LNSIYGRAEEKTNLTGWISYFQPNDAGAIQEKLFMVPTTSINGIANAIAPAPFNDEWVALTDYRIGYVQI
jgi:carboxy-cis,cis-muconate cyclase